MEEKSRDGQAPPAQSADWVIWQGPGRGYVTLEGDLPQLADALEVLWFLRAQRYRTAALLGARGGAS